MRILCVWSPTWAITNWKRRNLSASPGEAPFALVALERGVRRLSAVDEGAAALGLYAGQRATDATALVPELAVADADPAADAAALTALADWCARFSPAVAEDAPDGLFLDTSGVDHLWGGEAALIADLLARLAVNGVPARAGLAGTAGSAWAAARFGDGATVIAPGDEAAFISPLPVAALRLEPGAAAQLARLGLARVSDLARLPRDQLTRRFGVGVLQQLDQALGQREEALVFRRPPNPWLARLVFVDPISAPEDLARVTADVAAKLCARLTAEGFGARRFELTFYRLDGTAQSLTIGLALPGREARAIARLFAPHLERVDPGFGLEVVTLSAEGVERLSQRQQRLDADADVAVEDGVAPLVDRLANRLGAARVWRDEAFPSYAPERAVRRAAPLSAAEAEGWDPQRPRPLRLFRHPEPIEAVAPVPDDPPILFRWRGRAHRVRRAEGPERLAEEWWRTPDGQTRDYYRVEDETGARFWLFRAGLYSAGEAATWWMHGLFG